jgi:hypothetical protein
LPKMLKLSKQVFIHGLIIIIALVTIQLLLDAYLHVFLLYMPPIGFALFLITMFAIQPLILGVLNIVIMHRLYSCKGWQIGFWLNGFFLLIFFSTINLLIQTIAGVPFSLGVGIVEVFLLSYPFGYLGKFSNRGCENRCQQRTSTTQTSN